LIKINVVTRIFRADRRLRRDRMRIPKPWNEMSVDEKLETLRHEAESSQRQSAATAKALDEIRRRVREIERRLEESLLD
jgi:hypothetical protein